MALTTPAIERKMGGGRLYFAGEAADEWIEFGKVKELSYKIDPEELKAMSEDGCMETVDDVTIKSITAELSFLTENINADNFSKGTFGKKVTKSYAVGDTLPNGTVAAAAIDVVEIKAAQELLKKEKLKYVGAKCEGKQFVVDFHSVTLKPDGDVSLQNKEFMQMKFSGEILAVDVNGKAEYFTTYLI